MRRLLLLALLTAIVAVPASASAAGAGSTLLVSRPDGLGPVPPANDGFSSPAAVSDDGRYALFSTSADGFAEGTDSKTSGLLLRDTQTGETTLVSRSDGKDGVAANADARRATIAVTPAGHVLVAFDSEATNLSDHVSGPIRPPHDRDSVVWLRDVTAGTTTLVSRATGAAGAPANNFSFGPSLAMTAGGPVVAFTTGASNLGGANGGAYLRTLDAATTQVLACRARDCSGNPQAAGAAAGDLRVVPSAPGTLCAPPLHPSPCVLAAFTDQSGLFGDRFNFQVGAAVATAPAAPGQTTGAFDTFREESVKADGTLGNKGAVSPSISSDGKAIAFLSFSTNLTGDAVPGTIAQAFVRRLDTGGNELLSRDGAPANQTIDNLDLGGDVNHLRAVFETLATNLGSPGTNQRHDFLRDVAAGKTSLVNPAGDSGGQPKISVDGSATLFGGLSPGLDDKPGDRFTRVHLRRLNAPGQPIELISRPNGTDPLADSSDNAFLGGSSSVSADGRFVAFTAIAPLVEGSSGSRLDKAYVRDLRTGRTILVSRASGAGGASADTDAFPSGISADGRKVVFSTAAGNIGGDGPPGVFQTYVRDLDANTTTLVSRADGADGTPAKVGAFGGAISGNGRAVLVNTSAPFDPAADDGQNHVYVRDLDAATTTLADRDSGAVGTVPASGSSGATINSAGDRVAWSSRGAIAGAPADAKDRVFVRDLPSRVTTLVSRADGADGAPANDRSTSPAIDAAGDTVAFSSTAANLGVAPGQTQIFVREVGDGTTRLVSQLPGAEGLAQQATRPSIDAAGDRVGFGAAPANGRGIAYVRDLPSATTEAASRVDGPDGAITDTDFLPNTSLSANGDCVVFDGRYADLGDGWTGRDFESVHMRVLRGECPGPQPVTGEVPPPGNDGGDGGPGTPPRPVLSSLAVVPSRFWTGGRRSGTTIRFKLSHAARVTLRFDRLSTGHRSGRRCVSSGKARGKRCTIVKRAGTLTVNGKAGTNRVRFAGKLKGKRLALGRYRVTGSAAGGTGKASDARASVIRAPKTKVRRR